METQYARTALLIGEKGVRKLQRSHVAVFGVGGVGGAVCEALARAGIGTLSLIDKDTVSLTNLNRQIIALESTVGMYKADIAAARVAEISPECRVTAHRTMFLPDTADQFDFRMYDYVVDAIDTVTGKLTIITKAKAAGVPVISAMGAGNKRDPAAFEVADIYETSVCPLAKVMRHECRKRGIDSLKVVYSKEMPVQTQTDARDEIADPGSTGRRSIPGSAAFVPSVAGLIIAGEIVNDLTAEFR